MGEVLNQNDRRLQFVQLAIIENLSLSLSVGDVQHVCCDVSVGADHDSFDGNSTERQSVRQFVQETDRILAPNVQNGKQFMRLIVKTDLQRCWL